MGKITVKHYLNTNLKSYKINGEDYYSVYILVTANRQNTKVKSIKFNELYTENNYNELIQENNPNLDLEISSITNISNIMIDILGEFDTSFFTILYTSSEDNILNKILEDCHYVDMYRKYNSADNGYYMFNLARKESNKFNINILDFINKKQIKRDNTNNMTVFYWFSDKVQNELIKFINENKPKIDKFEIRNKINLFVFYSYLNGLSEIFKKKKKELYNKYESIFSYYVTYIDKLTEEYGKYGEESRSYQLHKQYIEWESNIEKNKQ